MYSQLIRAVQQRVTFSHIQTLIDEYIKQDGNEIFLEKYQQVSGISKIQFINL